MGNRVSHLDLDSRLDTGDDISYIAGGDLLRRAHFQTQVAHLVCLILLARIEELHFVPSAYHSVHNLEICYHTSERIEDRIEYQSL